jgi:hypothetical protein
MNNVVAARFLYFKRVFDLIKSLDGNIVECGVWKGESFGNWNQIFRKNKPVINQVVRLFDYESGQEFALQFKGNDNYRLRQI